MGAWRAGVGKCPWNATPPERLLDHGHFLRGLDAALVRNEAVRATDEVVELEELRHRVVQEVRVAPSLPATRTLVVLVGRSLTDCVNAEVSVPSADTVTMQLGSTTAGATVSGRLTTGGQPLSGVAVIATPKGGNVQENRFPGFWYRAGWAEATDGAGAAKLRCLPEGEPHTIRIGGWGFVQQVIEVPQPSLEAAPTAIVVRVCRKG